MDVHVCNDGAPRNVSGECGRCGWRAPETPAEAPAPAPRRAVNEVRALRARVVELEAEVERLCGLLRTARGLDVRPLRGDPSEQLLDEARRLGIRGLARAVGVGPAEVSRVVAGKVGVRPARLARWLERAKVEPTPLRGASRRGALTAPAVRVAE